MVFRRFVKIILEKTRGGGRFATTGFSLCFVDSI